MREGNRRKFKIFLALGIALGVLFVFTQGYEYIHAPFSFKNSIYGATFFMATGFHGAHVIIGVIFLFVCLMRAFKGQFTPKHHVGFQFAAWYWHFVDVVWLFLFACIYIWGSWGATWQASEEMAEPFDNVRAGMTGRHEVVVTRELTVGAHLDGMPFVFGTPMMILALGGRGSCGRRLGLGDRRQRSQGGVSSPTARVPEVSGLQHAARGRSARRLYTRSARGRTARRGQP